MLEVLEGSALCHEDREGRATYVEGARDSEWCCVVYSVCWCFMLCMLFCMLLRILEAVQGELYLLKMPEVMRCMLLCILEAVKGEPSFGEFRNFHCGKFLVTV